MYSPAARKPIHLAAKWPTRAFANGKGAGAAVHKVAMSTITICPDSTKSTAVAMRAAIGLRGGQ